MYDNICQSKDGRFQLNFFTLQTFLTSDRVNFFSTVEPVEPVEWTPRSDGLPLPLSLPNLSEMLAEGRDVEGMGFIRWVFLGEEWMLLYICGMFFF